jgi:hypothetical protein
MKNIGFELPPKVAEMAAGDGVYFEVGEVPDESLKEKFGPSARWLYAWNKMAGIGPVYGMEVGEGFMVTIRKVKECQPTTAAT